MSTLHEFMNQFQFDPQRNLFIGVERECHLLDTENNIVPLAPKILRELPSRNDQFTYELSACQLEWRVGPCKDIFCLKEELKKREATIECLEKRMGFKRSFKEVAPDDMPLDVYPDPSGRYCKIVRDMPQKVLLAACQVIATHIHIGMPNHRTALKVYNKAVEHSERLCRKGDHSGGKRLKIYKIVAPNCQPTKYGGWKDFYEKAKKENFVNDPRSCWTLIRISKHGTIEFRMFGATGNIDEILNWAEFCRNICKQAQI